MLHDFCMGTSDEHDQKHFSINLATARCETRSVQIKFQSLRYASERRIFLAESDDRHNLVTQTLAVTARTHGRTKPYHTNTSGFKKFLKRYRSKKGVPIVIVGKNGLPLPCGDSSQRSSSLCVGVGEPSGTPAVLGPQMCMWRICRRDVRGDVYLYYTGSALWYLADAAYNPDELRSGGIGRKALGNLQLKILSKKKGEGTV